MKTYDLGLHLFNKVNKPYQTFCGEICAPCYIYYYCNRLKYKYKSFVHFG